MDLLHWTQKAELHGGKPLLTLPLTTWRCSQSSSHRALTDSRGEKLTHLSRTGVFITISLPQFHFPEISLSLLPKMAFQKAKMESKSDIGSTAFDLKYINFGGQRAKLNIPKYNVMCNDLTQC